MAEFFAVPQFRKLYLKITGGRDINEFVTDYAGF